jgi:hypothetical protein
MTLALPVSIGIAILGFVPLFIVLWKRHRINKLKNTGDRVTGIVEEIKRYTGYKGNTYYRALIRYTAFGGQTLHGIYTYSCSRKRPLFIRGEHVEIYYSKAKPEKFVPKKGSQNTIALIFTIIMAAGYIVISCFLYGFIKNGCG